MISWHGLSPGERTRVRHVYDACVARMDERLDSLLNLVDLEETVVAMTSDHGEGFDYDRGRIHHGGRLHDDLVNVPCAISVPSRIASKVGEGLVAWHNRSFSLCDVAPTMLHLVGADPFVDVDGRSLLLESDSARVLPLEDRRYLYLRGGHRLNVNTRGKNTTIGMRLRNRMWRATAAASHNLTGWIKYPHKLIITVFTPNRGMPLVTARPLLRRLAPRDSVLLRSARCWLALELFDLESDRDESVNILVTGDAVEVWAQISERMGAMDDATMVLDGERRALESLFRSPGGARAS